MTRLSLSGFPVSRPSRPGAHGSRGGVSGQTRGRSRSSRPRGPGRRPCPWWPREPLARGEPGHLRADSPAERLRRRINIRNGPWRLPSVIPGHGQEPAIALLRPVGEPAWRSPARRSGARGHASPYPGHGRFDRALNPWTGWVLSRVSTLSSCIRAGARGSCCRAATWPPPPGHWNLPPGSMENTGGLREGNCRVRLFSAGQEIGQN